MNRNNEIIKAKQDITVSLGETQIAIERLKEKRNELWKQFNNLEREEMANNVAIWED